MSIESKLKNMLVRHGLFEHMAEDVFETFKNLEMNKSMIGKWNDNASDYPEQLLNILWFGLKQETLKYIDEKLPNAWFRDVFI